MKHNKTYKIYDKQTGTWFEVDREEYIEFDRWRRRLRQREQYHNRCMCPCGKWWLCDGMCQDCEYHVPEDVIELDAPIKGKDGEDMLLLETLAAPAPLMESAVCDQAELEALFIRLNEIMPEAVMIGGMRLEGFSDETIAKAVGIKRKTFTYRLKKAKKLLLKEFPYLF